MHFGLLISIVWCFSVVIFGQKPSEWARWAKFSAEAKPCNFASRDEAMQKIIPADYRNAANKGAVTFHDQLIVRSTCAMDFTSFPFDAMHCDYPMAVPQFMMLNGQKQFIYINVEFANPPAIVNEEFNVLSTHKVGKIEALKISTNSFVDVEVPVIRIHFTRFYTHYIFLGYIPNTITVFVAYLSFYVDPGAVPGRITLGISSLIAMVLQYGNIVKTMPKVGYVKSIDLWNIGCICFIFSVLLEFAGICYAKRCKNKKRDVDAIDYRARILYPICYFCFAFVYFTMSIHYH